MHRTGHWLSLDVLMQPLCSARKWRKLKAGMVLTVEPGIYISDQLKKCIRAGITLAFALKTMLVTARCKVLSRKAPKTIAEIKP